MSYHTDNMNAMQTGERHVPSPVASVSQSAETKRSLLKQLGSNVVSLLIKAILIVLVVAIGVTFVFGVIVVDDLTMEPSLKSGDIALYYRLDKTYVLHDLVVVRVQSEDQIRRVVAREGDVVDIVEGNLVVNDAIQQERFIINETERFVEGIDFPVILMAGQVFLLSDDRVIGADSRVYGPVDIDDTQGKIVTLVRKRGL